MHRPDVTGFFDRTTNTISYVVADSETRRAAIVDPVLDFDAASGRTKTENADKLLTHVTDNELTVEWILETHIHADHITAAPYLKSKLSAKVAIGENVTTVQRVFAPIFNLKGLSADGRQFDQLFADQETFSVGNIETTRKMKHG